MKTKTAIEHLMKSRLNLVALLEKHESKINEVPVNYNNSLFWNAAHCLVTMQLLCYKLSGNEMLVSDELVNLYRKGTKAEEGSNKISLEELKKALIYTAEQLKVDFEKGLFKNYNQYETSYGVQLNSIEEAISFNNIHEGLHIGYILSMVKSIK